jgi:hypothetical protein
MTTDSRRERLFEICHAILALVADQEPRPITEAMVEAARRQLPSNGVVDTMMIRAALKAAEEARAAM